MILVVTVRVRKNNNFQFFKQTPGNVNHEIIILLA